MLPTTTRKQLRVPHHVAIACAAVCLALAFLADIQIRSELGPTAESASALKVETPQKRSVKHAFPRLLPWKAPAPRSE